MELLIVTYDSTLSFMHANSKLLTHCPPAMQLDRFIPSRSALDVDVSSYNLLKENASVAEIPQKVTMPLMHCHGRALSTPRYLEALVTDFGGA